MDLVTFTLAKKYTDSKVFEVSSGIIPEIGENGNWIIAGIDSGKKAVCDLEPASDTDIDNLFLTPTD